MTKQPCQSEATPAVLADVISPPAELPACFCRGVSCSYSSAVMPAEVIFQIYGPILWSNTATNSQNRFNLGKRRKVVS